MVEALSWLEQGKDGGQLFYFFVLWEPQLRHRCNSKTKASACYCQGKIEIAESKSIGGPNKVSWGEVNLTAQHYPNGPIVSREAGISSFNSGLYL